MSDMIGEVLGSSSFKFRDLFIDKLYETNEVSYPVALELVMSMDISINDGVDFTNEEHLSEVNRVISEYIELILYLAAHFAEKAANKGESITSTKLAFLRSIAKTIEIDC